MFGNSNKDDTNNVNTQNSDMNNFGVSQSTSDISAPSLPTMGGQNSPFGAPQTPTSASQPDPQATPAPDDDQNQIPHHEDTDHMVTDHGTPDPDEPAEPVSGSDPAPTGDLVDIKQQALSQLSPLVSHLDQSAEEKFRTTMMMIQATDDQSLLKAAFEAAQKIEDDKARAQALLDVINEINYFTQQSK